MYGPGSTLIMDCDRSTSRGPTASPAQAMIDATQRRIAAPAARRASAVLECHRRLGFIGPASWVSFPDDHGPSGVSTTPHADFIMPSLGAQLTSMKGCEGSVNPHLERPMGP